jgi:hypothetical protein
MEVVLFVLGLVIGAAINWGFARQSSKQLTKAAEDLKTETRTVRRLVNTMARGLDSEGYIQANFDESGELVGIKFFRTRGSVQAAASGNLQATAHKASSGTARMSGTASGTTTAQGSHPSAALEKVAEQPD